MVNPPKQKIKQQGYVQTAVRLPPDLHDDLRDAATRSGHSLNAEILARLRTSPLEEIKRQNVELKAMLREVLDKM
jgi:predicted HicB family RNase H-like nuclease